MKNEKKTGFQNPGAALHAHLDSQKKWYDRAADSMTSTFGTFGFLIANIIFFAAWIIINLDLFPGIPAFDPFPFNFLTMVVSLEAIVLSVIVLVSQNKASKIADLRQELDFEINVRAEQEITRIIKMIEAMHDHLGMPKSQDTELAEMKKDINIANLEKAIKDREN